MQSVAPTIGLAALLLVPASAAAAQQESDEPALPMGLGDFDEPELPMGLGDAPAAASAPLAQVSAGPWADFGGFFDGRLGARPSDATDADRHTLAELRLHLTADKQWERASVRLAVDLVDDALAEEQRPDLETGEGVVDLREAYVVVSPFAAVDIKLGRQILTWGTGDLLFVNDLFPKDWNAFLLGRDVEYLKAPSDAVKASLFTDVVNVDAVYVPRFDADRFPDRARLSSWDPARGKIVGTSVPIRADRPDRWFSDHEIALRLHRRLGAVEVAAYGYRGFWKSPAGFDGGTGHVTFPSLAVYGASVRSPLLGGIANAEVGLYDSYDDPDGDDPTVANSELRALFGYEHEVVRSLTLSMQYSLEHTLDVDADADADRHVVTARLTWLALSQRLRASLFVFYGASDEDAYLRPHLRYEVDDHWRAEVGGNLLMGARQDTAFGGLQDNTNGYVALRYAW